MARELKPRRGTTAQHAAFTGALNEVTLDTTKKTLVIHDGVTAGGAPLPTFADLTGGVQTITGVDGLVVDDTDPLNPILSTTAVLKTSTPLQAYGTNSAGAPSYFSPENVSFSQAASPIKGVVTLDCEAAIGRTTKVFVNDNVTSWVFNNRPPAGYYYVLDVYIIQDAAPKTCVSPATAGKTAGGAWTISGTASSTQRLILKVTSTDVELYPFPVLS